MNKNLRSKTSSNEAPKQKKSQQTRPGKPHMLEAKCWKHVPPLELVNVFLPSHQTCPSSFNFKAFSRSRIFLGEMVLLGESEEFTKKK